MECRCVGDRGSRDQWLGAGASLAAHLAIIIALAWAWTESPKLIAPSPAKVVEPAPVNVALIDEPTVAAPPTPAASPQPARPSPVKPPPRLKLVRAVRTPPPDVEPLPQGAGPAEGVSDELSGAQLAGAASADSGSGGRPCDMARRLQAALRRDPLVQAEVARSHTGKAFMVWNGGWVKSDGEDGKGLAATLGKRSCGKSLSRQPLCRAPSRCAAWC